MSPPLTFFRGRTCDGAPWVLSFEDGPTATDSERCCVVSGMVATTKVPALSIDQGVALKELLPLLRFDEVEGALRELTLPW